MKTYTLPTRITAIFLICAILFSSCGSTTTIMSNPSGADLTIDGIKVGQTPYNYRDYKVSFSTTSIKLEKEGYVTMNAEIEKDKDVHVGAVIGGIFFFFPFIWTLKYQKAYSFELEPSSNQTVPYLRKEQSTGSQKSKAERLRELKELLDEGIITQSEFDKEKKKILDEEGE